MSRFLLSLIPALAQPAGAAPRQLDLAALVGADGWGRLPAAVRRRFGVDHGAATYVGRMELRCSQVGRVHALLSRLFGSPLCGATASDVLALIALLQARVQAERGIELHPEVEIIGED